MKTLNLSNTVHKFEKQNLVTTKGGYDVLVCSKCGLKVKRATLGDDVTVMGRASREKIDNCNLTKEDFEKDFGKEIQITNCTAVGAQFDNIVPGSIHTTIPAPKGEKNDAKGVWVEGVGEVVKILNNEFRLAPKVEPKDEIPTPKPEEVVDDKDTPEEAVEVVEPGKTTKKCIACGGTFELTEFRKASDRADGHGPRCHKCHKEWKSPEAKEARKLLKAKK